MSVWALRLVSCHSWLRRAVQVCVLGLNFRLRPATPGWSAGVCVCLCARSDCTQPLLAGVCCVGVCAWARVSAAPRHSQLGCWGVCVFVCALRLYSATLGCSVRCGCVCLGSGFSCAPPLLAGVLGCVCVCVHSPLGPLPLLAAACGAGSCAWARVRAASRHSWLGCWGVCLFMCVLRLYPATPGWGLRCGCVCLGSGFGCAPPLLAAVLRCVCFCVCTPLVPRHSLLGCAVWVCVLGLGFRLRPATPGWGVGVCVCLFARSACTPHLPAWVCGVGVCPWARVSAAHRHSWLGCAVWVCVFGLGFRLRAATPGCSVAVCVCLFARSACTPHFLAWVCGVGVCPWARVSAAPRHPWLGCWGVCVFVCALRLHTVC